MWICQVIRPTGDNNRLSAAKRGCSERETSGLGDTEVQPHRKELAREQQYCISNIGAYGEVHEDLMNASRQVEVAEWR